MKLRITRKAARYCKRYFDNDRCLVSTAARFRFPRTRNIHAGGDEITIGKKTYEIAESGRIQQAYDDSWQKIRPDFEPFTVELTRV